MSANDSSSHSTPARPSVVATALLVVSVTLPSGPPAAAAGARTQGEDGPERVQTDWSGGPGEEGPVTRWERGFDGETGVAWRSIAGQLALSGTPRPQPLHGVIEEDADLPAGVATGDLDGDGWDDVVVADPLSDFPNDFGTIYWWRRDAAGAWERQVVSEDFYGAWFVDVVDLDRDGDEDVIAAAYYGIAEPEPPPPPERNGRYAWFENLDGEGGAWERHVVGELFWGANWVDAGDIDGDGDLDLVGASELTDGPFQQRSDITWFENLGDGDAWLQHDVDDDFDNASGAHLADLDGDDDLDIVATHSANTGPTFHHWFENTAGNGSAWLRHQVPIGYGGSGYVAVGDLDDDGDLDLMGSGLSTGVIAWWENLAGDASSWQAFEVGVHPTGKVVRLADLDGDGDLDGVAASGLMSFDLNRVTWFENLPGAGWATRQLGAFEGGRVRLDVGDPDRDGKLDAVVAQEVIAAEEDEVFWLDPTTFLRSGQLTSAVLDAGAPEWGPISWDAVVPPGADLAVEVRASDDPEDLGVWVDVPASGSELEPLIGPDPRFLQYRLTLTSADPEVSPQVREVRVLTGPTPEIFADGWESGDTSSWDETID